MASSSKYMLKILVDKWTSINTEEAFSSACRKSSIGVSAVNRFRKETNVLLVRDYPNNCGIPSGTGLRRWHANTKYSTNFASDWSMWELSQHSYAVLTAFESMFSAEDILTLAGLSASWVRAFWAILIISENRPCLPNTETFVNIASLPMLLGRRCASTERCSIFPWNLFCVFKNSGDNSGLETQWLQQQYLLVIYSVFQNSTGKNSQPVNTI